MKKCSGNSIWIRICITATVLVAAIRAYVVRKSRDNQRAGSVTDLVRRGQLRSGDRRGMYVDNQAHHWIHVGRCVFNFSKALIS